MRYEFPPDVDQRVTTLLEKGYDTVDDVLRDALSALEREQQEITHSLTKSASLSMAIGHRPTHRAVFAVRSDLVLVLRVRHLAQQEIASHD